MFLFHFVFTMVIPSRRISSANITQSTPELIFATMHGTNWCSYIRSVFIQQTVAASTISLEYLHFACWTLFCRVIPVPPEYFPFSVFSVLLSQISPFGSLNVYGARYISRSVSHQKVGSRRLDVLEDGWVGLSCLFFFFFFFLAWVVPPYGLVLPSLLVVQGAGLSFEMWILWMLFITSLSSLLLLLLWYYCH